MSRTVVGLFQSTAAAQQVKQTLVDEGYPAGDIRIVANDHDEDLSTSTPLGSDRLTGSDRDAVADTTNRSSTGEVGESIGEKISNFFRNLTGGDEHAHHHYATGINQGGALLTVTTDDEDAAEVANLLRQHGAHEIEGDGRSSTGTATSAFARDSSTVATDAERFGGQGRNPGTENLTGETAIPVIEESLVVGKREIDRGGVRVYSHVVERPAEADVTLRDQRVKVERRTVDRPATAADFEAGNASSFELRASGEEAVVSKNSRVVEEVIVGKESTERTEAVHDTIRKTEVEVEQIPGNLAEKDRY